MSQLAPLPIEIWRYIISFVDKGGQEPSARFPTAFDQSYKSSSKPPSRLPSISTKYALTLVSRRFKEIASEFLYHTLYIRNVEDARSLAANEFMVQKWTRNITIAPVFPKSIGHKEFYSHVQDFGQAVQTILENCGKPESIIIRVDAASKRVGFNEHWMKICRAIPHGCRHLEIDDETLEMAVWEPKHLFESKLDSYISSLRLTFFHGSHEYTFTNVTHLALFSWPIASKWTLPALTDLDITYFPNLPLTQAFWLTLRPNLRSLRFGSDTRLADFEDFPHLVTQTAPNLQTLEYYYYGDVEILWDPAKLPTTINKVNIKIFHHSSVGSSQGKLLDSGKVGKGRQLTTAAVQRWRHFTRHLAPYRIRPTILVPEDALRDDLLIVVKRFIVAQGADVAFSSS